VRTGGAGLAVALAHTAGARAVGRFRATPAAAQPAAETFAVTGLVDQPLTLTVADLRALGPPVETVAVTYLDLGIEERYEFTGVRLHDLLDAAGIVLEPDKYERLTLRTRYVVVTAKDAYQVVFSGGELDPTLGNRPILVAWERDGRPLEDEFGPVQVVVPGDLHGDRYIWGVVGVELRGIDAPSA
jgi:DMSO/TMAO reductase YedYZ molybdopterin-dependent catalytic subunit